MEWIAIIILLAVGLWALDKLLNRPGPIGKIDNVRETKNGVEFTATLNRRGRRIFRRAKKRGYLEHVKFPDNDDERGDE